MIYKIEYKYNKNENTNFQQQNNENQYFKNTNYCHNGGRTRSDGRFKLEDCVSEIRVCDTRTMLEPTREKIKMI